MKTWIINNKDYQKIFNVSNSVARKMIASDRRAIGRKRIHLFDLLLIYGFDVSDVINDLK